MALLHDAPEYVIGDMISPFKAALGLDYKAFETKLEAAIHLRFGLPAHPPAPVKGVIKRADIDLRLFRSDAACRLREDEAQALFRRAAARRSQLDLTPLPDRAGAGGVSDALPLADRSGLD